MLAAGKKSFGGHTAYCKHICLILLTDGHMKIIVCANQQYVTNKLFLTWNIPLINQQD